MDSYLLIFLRKDWKDIENKKQIEKFHLEKKQLKIFRNLQENYLSKIIYRYKMNSI